MDKRNGTNERERSNGGDVFGGSGVSLDYSRIFQSTPEKPAPKKSNGVVISVFRNDAKVKVKLAPGERKGGGKRSKICKFSKASRQNLLHTAFNACAEFKQFVTLTYPEAYTANGQTVKAHLNTFLSAVRFYLKERGFEFRYMWALEFQKRGAPHFHLLLEHDISEKWLLREWYNVVGSGDKKHLRRGVFMEQVERNKGAGYYMARHYGAKAKQKAVPEAYHNVGRFWGASRGLAAPLEVCELDASSKMTKETVRTLRRYTEHKLKESYLENQKRQAVTGKKTPGMKPVTKGRIVNFETGEIIPKRRKRPIHRPKRLANLRGAHGVTFAKGFKVIDGSKVAGQLLKG